MFICDENQARRKNIFKATEKYKNESSPYFSLTAAESDDLSLAHC